MKRISSMIGWFKNQELARKLILINFILVMLPLSIMGYFAFSRFAATLEQKVGDYQQQTMKQLTLNLDTYMAELDRLTLMPYQYEPIIAFLESKRDQGQALTLEEIKQLNGFVSQVFLNGRIDIVGVSLFGESGASYVVLPESQYVTTYKLDENAKWLKNEQMRNGQSTFIGTHNIQSTGGTIFPVFSIARELRSFDTGKKLGYIVIDVAPSVIHQILSQVTLGNRDAIYITDQNGGVVAGKEHAQPIAAISSLLQDGELEGVTHAAVNGERQLVSFVTSSVTEWKTIGIVPVAELMKDSFLIRNSIMLLGIICVGLAMLMSVFLAFQITKPLRGLIKLMRKVEHGDLLVSFPVKQWDEVGHLGKAFNTMVSKLSELGYLLYETEIREKDAQIAALQSKINPHFLYNTLGSISMYAEVEGNQEVVKMTNNLSRLLRYSLNGQKERVSLKDELDHVRGYMTIQKMRYEERIDFQLESIEAALTCKVIPLIIQPIVENAINHGIDQGIGNGRISLSCRIDESLLRIVIEDDGIGMTEEKLSAIRRRLQYSKDLGGSSGNGLLNVHRRIVLHYGELYGLSLESMPYQGMKVILTLPAVHEELFKGREDIHA
ncbi:two-component system sensor histidine kinase YesM [Paenibacillus endophyticus]|uniref:histidine kinase n=1 Tax=Paenibacillus endophyticus TaxID=1294268 RepID=A0A7W5C4Y0_9BACL|nr:sensor histidine kinase [Paenibacillus endophyticus]MBB3150779.1 two-component system sensor histidine kinase YesM [Paenibacillus endophyticus]